MGVVDGGSYALSPSRRQSSCPEQGPAQCSCRIVAGGPRGLGARAKRQFHLVGTGLATLAGTRTEPESNSGRRTVVPVDQKDRKRVFLEPHAQSLCSFYAGLFIILVTPERMIWRQVRALWSNTKGSPCFFPSSSKTLSVLREPGRREGPACAWQRPRLAPVTAAHQLAFTVCFAHGALLTRTLAPGGGPAVIPHLASEPEVQGGEVTLAKPHSW